MGTQREDDAEIEPEQVETGSVNEYAQYWGGCCTDDVYLYT